MTDERHVSVRGTKFVKTATFTPDYHGTLPKLTETSDGKYVMGFEALPALLFVSMDGHGSNDQLFVHGEEILTAASAEIKSKPGELTMYSTESYAALRTINE